MDFVEIVDEITENCSILLIVAFRFYILSMAKSFKRMVQTQKAEMLYYFLFLTHKCPFELLNYTTGLSWEHVQGVWMRIIIVLCLWVTVRAKLTSYSFKMGKSTGLGGGSSLHGEVRTAGPVESSVYKSAKAPNAVTVIPLPLVSAAKKR